MRTPNIKPRTVIAYYDHGYPARQINWRYKGVAVREHPSGGAWWIAWELDATSPNAYGRCELPDGWYGETVLTATGGRA
jgi:hypothetical protein